MGRLAADAWAEQNGTKTKAIRSEKANLNLRIGFSSSAQRNNLFRAKHKVYTGNGIRFLSPRICR
jgi:hypothetical protein